LNRLLQKTYPDNTAVNYTYDNDSRLIQVSDPTGTYQFTFDNMGRLTQATTSYTFLTGRNFTASYSYDADNRRTSLTLPNGVVTTYSYDNASQLTGMTYTNASTALGNLAYSYDLNGRRTNAGGSYARTNLPNAVSATAYNANNQLTTWGTANLFYDLNGNMTSDGTHSYAWDARNRLNQIDLGNTASFTYDPFRRRATKNILATTTSFLYDRANAVQEVIGGTNTANSLMGGVDEVFQWTDSVGARSFLSDALGGTLALTDSTGTAQTSYTYEPFGNTTVSGTATTSSFAYTGRELDANNLYYYRARYYNPQLQRFISEDPLGASAGPNLYQYAGSSPSNFTDPLGLIYGVSQSGDGTITIWAPITLYGDAATPKLARDWQQDIDVYWNGHTWKGCKVVVQAPITLDTPENIPWGNGDINSVKVVNTDEEFRDLTVLYFGWGWWWRGATAADIAHEFGHLLNLADQYYDFPWGSVPKPGFEIDIMGSTSGFVHEDTLNRVLAGRACGCNK
jgi:RHS repeat-associated protein